MTEKENTQAILQPISETLEKNYMPYAMSVIVSRALPEIDGFKPSHRKLLYTMYKMGLLTGKRTKSANVVGQTMKLNPHGDAAIYETLVRLTRGNEALLHPYIDSKGNFGKQYSRDMAYAASRYTEVKLDSICQEIFSSIDKDTVEFKDNYDSTMQEPVLLPAAFPSILVNANQGIAVGMASQIPSFNLTEVCNATIAYIKDPGNDIMEQMPAPDFESGAQIIYDRDLMADIYRTGRGSFKMRANYKVDKKKGMIEILEIPYLSTLERIIDEITDLVKTNKIKEINDVRDESDKDGFKITIDYKKSFNPNTLMLKLFRFTELEKNFGCNLNILINGSPRVLGIKQILGEWTSWRRSLVRREVAHELQKKSEKLHLLKALERILLDIDAAIRIIRSTEKAADVIPNLMTEFSIDLLQAEFVADIRLRNLNNEYILNRIAEIKELKDEISKLKNILATPELIDDLIIEDLVRISRKYGKPRKTVLTDIEKKQVFKEELMIEDYNVRLYLTAHGYFKKLALTSLRNITEIRTKEDDWIVQEEEATNKSEILFFSDKSAVYKMRIHEIEDHRPSDWGEYLTNTLELDEDEEIIFMHVTNDYSGILLLAFENGKAAKLSLSAYITKTNRRKLINAYSDASPVIGMIYLPVDEEAVSKGKKDEEKIKEKDLVLVGDSGRHLVFSSSRIPLKATRTNNGVQVMNPLKGGKAEKLMTPEEAGITDKEFYRTRNIPARGYPLKEGTYDSKQIAFAME